MKKIYAFLLFLLSLTGARAEDLQFRPMLTERKTWAYVYHHFEERETPGPDGNYYDHSMWMAYYQLRGDTIIDGRKYKKMFRVDERYNTTKYFGAFREDEEGRVYLYDYYGNKKDKKMIDFSWNFDDDIELTESINTDVTDSIGVDTIKVNGKNFRRYRHYVKWTGVDYFVDGCAVEGVGYEEAGLVHYIFEPKPTCICDYESLFGVYDKDYYFDALDFNDPKEIDLTDDERQLVSNNNDFAFNLLRTVRKQENDKSLVLSPLSITYALGMLNNGAAGQTQEEINRVLGFGDVGADAINAFCRKMLTETGTLDSRTKALIANTIYVNEGLGFRLQEGFVDKARIFYDATPEARDFHDGVTMDVINKWASEHTEGIIDKVLDENTFDANAVSYLLNAICFKGSWKSKFDKKDTRDEPFGTTGTIVPMMWQRETFYYADDDFCQYLILPYGNGAYRMTVFLPHEDKTLSDVLEGLSGQNWQDWQKKGGLQDVDLKLPRFETSVDQDLVPVMETLGMQRAFCQMAEFPYFCNTDTYIGLMKQNAKIHVDEEGTEAAAVTVIALPTGTPQYYDFHATRPFLYTISEQSTGTILFIGQYLGNDGTDDIQELKPLRTEDVRSYYTLYGRRVTGQPTKGIYIQNGRKLVIK